MSLGTVVPLADGGAVLIAHTDSWKHVGEVSRSFRLAAGGTWSEIPPAYAFIGEPTAVTLTTPGIPSRDGAAAASLPDGRVLVAGGAGPAVNSGNGYSDDTTKDADLYDPATGAWTNGAAMPEPRANGIVVALPDRSILVIGGDWSDAIRRRRASARSSGTCPAADAPAPAAQVAAAGGAFGRVRPLRSHPAAASGVMTISGRPVTTSHAGRIATQRIGSICASPTRNAARNRASQPLRVTATRIPTRLAATASAWGMPGTNAFTASPNATPTKTAGKIRPPRNPDVPATTTATSLIAPIRARPAAEYSLPGPSAPASARGP